ncbi:MAG: hypothetical protein UW68_C0007G0008 [Candidatus Collierbacteria bacterium GW2011_GWB1_44_6]|uniref:Uncharacterized protein n=1 Tax=Candidatus Collierbacteria bacterium GW2011_GWB1_44_6 TaxID=1618384 RepID=A0A0G1JQ69_9BACT|nr:MAG: hypothetical protein UW68_C0007G0008 [Candidatus Collierbacteria bacterium GW2011_GWB1_44_6]
MGQGIGGTPGVPYEKDVEYWVRFLREQWVESAITQEIIDKVRASKTMLEARKVAMEFHDSMLMLNNLP